MGEAKSNFSDPFLLVHFDTLNDTRLKYGLISTLVASNILFALTVISIPLLAMGIVANVINLVVFQKQGYRESINITLTSLTVSDLASLVLMAWQSTTFFPAFQTLNWAWRPNEVLVVTGSIPRTYFSRVSSQITVYLAIERCVSVIKPLQVKFIFTKRRQFVILVAIFCVNPLVLIGAFYTNRLRWNWDPRRNKTYLGLSFLENRQLADDIGMAFGLISLYSTFIIVASCAVILVWTLSKQWQWRSSAYSTSTPTSKPKIERQKHDPDNAKPKDSSKSNNTKNSEGISSKKVTKKAEGVSSNKDKRAATTVMLLAFMFVFCYFPGVLCQTAMLSFSEFSRSGLYRNAYNVFWIISLRAEGVCSSANIVVYFKSSTKFRETFLHVFCPCRKRKI